MIVSGSVRMLSPIETASQARPQRCVRLGRMNQWMARDPLHPRRQGPQQPAQPRTGELRRPQHQRELQVDVAGVEIGPERERKQGEDHGGRQRPLAVRPVDGPEQQQDRAAAPDEPGDVPRQGRPRREQREHPRGVDVGQERAGRVVGVAAVEPDADRRPVRPRIGPAGLAPCEETGREHGERQAEQEDRGDPSRVVEARPFASQGPPEDPRPPPCRTVDHRPEVDDDPPATPGRARDRTETGRLLLVGHDG